MSSPRVVRILAVGAAVLVVLAACGSGSGARDDDFLSTPYYRVLYDDAATVRDVVSVASAPYDLELAGDGSTLAVFRIEDQEGGEASRTVWRLVDPDGHVVRERFAPQFTQVVRAGGRFYLVDEESDPGHVRVDRVDRGGGTHRVASGAPVRSTRPGDVVVQSGAPVAVLRSGRVRPLRTGVADAEKVTVDPSTGRLALISSRSETALSLALRPGGSTTLPVGPGRYPLQLVADHGTVVLALGDDMDADATTEVWGGPATGRSAGVRRIGTLRQVHSPSVLTLPGGTLLVGDVATGWWSARPDSGGFDALDLPGRADDLLVSGHVLVAFPTRLQAGGRGPTYVREAAGGPWRRLDLGPGAP